jgi:D-sedoheptulose 7-phosphate isomerase
VAIGLSTSGRSANVIEGLAAANARGLRTVALCGRASPALRRQAEFCVFTPAADTARVQECHMLVGHIICEIVERSLFPREAR